MALSGTINGSTSNQYIDAKIVWSAKQNIAGNYSTVTATLYYKRNNTGYTTYGTWSGKITVDGKQVASSTSLTIGTSDVKAIFISTNVQHDSDGKKTITISASGSMSGTTLKSTSVSGTITLDTIPRTSSVSMSDATMGNESTITITRASSSFTHTLTYTFGTKTKEIAKKTTSTSVKWTPAVSDFASQIPNATSGTGKLTCDTYNGDTKIGSVSITVKLSLSSDVKPTLESLTLTPSQITLTNDTKVSVLVKNKNKLNLKASGAKAGEGSTISYYTFSGLSCDTKVSTTNNNASISIGPIDSISANTTLTYTVTVTDTRGRTSEPAKASITCYNYSEPSISSFKVYRCNANEQEDANGSYLKCTYVPTYTEVSSYNSATVTAYYNGSSKNGSNGSVLINLDGNTSTTYKVYLTIRDRFGGSYTTSSKMIYGDFRIFNITKNGTGFALGKMAESNNLFECRWPAKFNDSITAGGFRIPEIQYGVVEITPSAANTPTSIDITFDQPFSGEPVITVTPINSVVGTKILGVGYNNRSKNGFKAWLTRTDTSSTNVSWIAMY